MEGTSLLSPARENGSDAREDVAESFADLPESEMFVGFDPSDATQHVEPQLPGRVVPESQTPTPPERGAEAGASGAGFRARSSLCPRGFKAVGRELRS